MIQENSTLDGVQREITDGIRVLGSPVGNASFCKLFISDMMTKAQEHAIIILSKLENKQSALQLYTFCTAQNTMYLVSADVYFPAKKSTGNKPTDTATNKQNQALRFETILHVTTIVSIKKRSASEHITSITIASLNGAE